MIYSKNIIKSLIFSLCLSLCWQTIVCAQPGGHGHHHPDGPWPDRRPPVGFHRPSLPETIAEIVVAGIRLFYDDGVYYRRERDVYIVVDPPIGAVVRVIPSYYQEIVINGVIYYTYDGIYYLRVRKGYKVVQPPVVTVVQPVPVVVQQTVSTTALPVSADGQSATSDGRSASAASSDPAEEEFTINIPNDKGGYTPVVIKRTKDGFVGPQGEFYSEFPRVAQLKIMYGTQAK